MNSRSWVQTWERCRGSSRRHSSGDGAGPSVGVASRCCLSSSRHAPGCQPGRSSSRPRGCRAAPSEPASIAPPGRPAAGLGRPMPGETRRARSRRPMSQRALAVRAPTPRHVVAELDVVGDDEQRHRVRRFGRESGEECVRATWRPLYRTVRPEAIRASRETGIRRAVEGELDPDGHLDDAAQAADERGCRCRRRRRDGGRAGDSSRRRAAVRCPRADRRARPCPVKLAYAERSALRRCARFQRRHRRLSHQLRSRTGRRRPSVPCAVLLLVDLDGVVYRGADPVPGVAAVLADRVAARRRRRLRHEQLDVLPLGVRGAARRTGRAGVGGSRRLVGPGDRALHPRARCRRSDGCSSSAPAAWSARCATSGSRW